MARRIACLQCRANNPTTNKHCAQCGMVLPDPTLGNLHELIYNKGLLSGTDIRQIYRGAYPFDFARRQECDAEYVLKRDGPAEVKRRLKASATRFFTQEAILTKDAIEPCLKAYKELRNGYAEQGEYTGSSVKYASEKTKSKLLPGIEESSFISHKLGLQFANDYLSDASSIVEEVTKGIWSVFPRSVRRFFDRTALKGFDLRYDREMVLLILDAVIEHLEELAQSKRLTKRKPK
jgi:hypothetical protein